MAVLLHGDLWGEEITVKPCILLQGIILSDSEVLTPRQQQALFKQYMGQCIDGKLLKSIIYDVSSFYMDRGYMTTRAYLKAQNIQDGQIEISLLKGFVEAIVDSATHRSNSSIATAFASQKGKMLNLRDLETSLEMVNRPVSSDASFAITPGHKAGASIVEVSTQKSSPYHLKIGGGGRKNLNDKNLYLSGVLSIDNPLNINDIFTLSYNGSRVQRAYQSNNGLELNYSFPIASYLLELVGSSFSYRQGVNGINDTYLSSGDTQGLRFRVNKVLLRDQTNKLNAALSVSYKDTKNYFSSQVIDVSTYRTSLAQADLTHTFLQSWGKLVTTYSYYQGTNWFGARGDSYRSAETGLTNQARLQFNKHSIDSVLNYAFSDTGYQLASNIHLQYSSDLLYDNDKLTVGSDYTVRGYSSPNLYGNNAWYIKNDLIKTWQLKLDESLLKSLSLAVGLDYGEVSCESDNLSSCGSIVGTALGLSSRSKNLSVSMVWSKPLKKLNHTFNKTDLFKFDFTWEF